LPFGLPVLLVLSPLIVASIFHVLGVQQSGEAFRREAALARAQIPSVCFFVDGEVWVYDSGRELRPRDPEYSERRQHICRG
jgi:hypothetical protein